MFIQVFVSLCELTLNYYELYPKFCLKEDYLGEKGSFYPFFRTFIYIFFFNISNDPKTKKIRLEKMCKLEL